MRWLLPTLLILLAVTAAFAQPMGDDCWLIVRVFRADGTPFPMAPAVSVLRVQNNARINAGRSIYSADNATTITELAPGKHEIMLHFRQYGLVDGPKPLELISGPNILDWTVPAVVPVQGSIQTDGVPLPVTARRQAYLAPVGRGSYAPVDATATPGGYTLFGVFPGRYRLLLLSEQGYGLVEFAATAEQPVKAPVALSAGSVLTVNAGYLSPSNQRIPLPNTTVSLAQTANPDAVIVLSLYTDRTGTLKTLALPPGAWRYTVYYPGYTSLTGDITLTAGAPAVLDATMVKQ